SALDEQVGARRGQTFGGGEGDHGRVRLPWPALLAVGQPGPEIHDRLAVPVHADRRADLAVRAEVGRARVPNRLEPLADRSAAHVVPPRLRAVYVLAHCWPVAVEQVAMTMGVPFAVPPPVGARQRLDSTPTMVPLEFSVHFWLLPPLQSQMLTV